MSDPSGGGTMSPKINDTGNVKWPHFFPIIAGIVMGLISIMLVINSDKIGVREFTQFEKRMDDKFDVVINAIKDLKK